jgi:hypothetical protein
MKFFHKHSIENHNHWRKIHKNGGLLSKKKKLAFLKNKKA